MPRAGFFYAVPGFNVTIRNRDRTAAIVSPGRKPASTGN